MTVPVGFLAEPLCALRNMLLASPAFLAWAGGGDELIAATRVHLVTTPRQPERPMALVDFGQMTRERQAVMNRVRFDHAAGSTLHLYLTADATWGSFLTDREEDQTITFCNAVSAIWADLELAAGNLAGRTLPILSIDLAEPPTRIVDEKRKQSGDLFEAVLTVTYTRQP